MWKDPIVAETRALRAEYARQFDDDADALFQDILRRQSAPGKKLVSFPPRTPVPVPVASPRGVEPDRLATGHSTTELEH